jgi:anti-sigma factor RsiW
MNCSSQDYKPDWKAYVLGELDAEERRRAEAHAAACSSCQEELASARLTLDALSTLREEEMPRRIAFVSDKVFEPRWWHNFLRPSFAGACVIAVAILAHGLMRPATDSTTIQARVDVAVSKAVADTEERNMKQMERLFADYDIIQRQNTLMYVKNTGLVR